MIKNSKTFRNLYLTKIINKGSKKDTFLPHKIYFLQKKLEIKANIVMMKMKAVNSK